MELDNNGLFGRRDTNEEEEDSDFTGGNVGGAAGLADELDNDDSTAINTEENLERPLELAATKLQKTRLNNLQ